MAGRPNTQALRVAQVYRDVHISESRQVIIPAVAERMTSDGNAAERSKELSEMLRVTPTQIPERLAEAFKEVGLAEVRSSPRGRR